MDRDEVARLAREAGCIGVRQHAEVGSIGREKFEELMRFAELVAAAEREACAVIADKVAAHPMKPVYAIAMRIRSRGNP